MSEQLKRDGVLIPIPSQQERDAFAKWLQQNRVNDPFHPDQHYDYVGAFRGQLQRDAGADGHFPDTYKLPGHETFSNESQYAVGDNAKYAGRWSSDTYQPATQRYTEQDPEFAKAVLQLFNTIATKR